MKAPAHLLHESPTLYADRIGEWYAEKTTASHKSQYGQYLTPPAAASFMAQLASKPTGTVRILDPGAGSGTLSCALCETLSAQSNTLRRIELVAYETESGLLKRLPDVLEYLKSWLSNINIELSYKIRSKDFILDNTANHKNILFPSDNGPELFDYIISNPPYFKILKDDARAKACHFVIHGQPNIYALFMAVSAHMLKPKGELIYIVPRSFAAGPYFRLFREKFFKVARPTQVHLFDSRTETFDRNEVLQEHVIIHAIRDEQWVKNQPAFQVQVSSSAGMDDLENSTLQIIPLHEVIDMTSYDKFFHIPKNNEELTTIRLVNSWTGSLHKYNMKISTGPVVPFRSRDYIVDSQGTNRVPLLWMQNVKTMSASWPVSTRKHQHIISNASSAYLLVPNRNYVLLRRFSAKEEHRRLTAAPYLAENFNFELIGLENHLNYIYKLGGELTKYEAYGIAAILNCKLIDMYFRSFNGNTQVSATELRSMPLPSLETIILIGKKAATEKIENGDLDEWITSMLKISTEAKSGKDRRSAGNSKGVRIAASAAK